MSLRVRLALLMALLVAVTLFFAWVLTRRAVLAPFAREVVKQHVDQALYVADELEAGADPDQLSRRLGLEIHLRRRPPGFVRHRRGPHCRPHEAQGRELFVCRGPRSPVAVRTEAGWLVVRRDLDLAAPNRRVGYVLLAVALAVIGLASWAAVLIVRPLSASVRAMERMASGDLSHRLEPGRGREEKEVARAFNAMADRVDRLLKAERELLAGISHELRTPLARLRLELELLREHEVPKKRLDAMEKDLGELDALIGEALDMSRLSVGDRKLAFEDLDLLEVAREAVTQCPLDRHEVAVEGEAQPLRGDRARLVRVVTNLLQNAGKYAPEGTEVLIRVDGRRLEVRDQGPGVPPDDLGRLFEPFYRGKRAKGGSATGVGLGLMIARQIVEMHRGTIEARNGEHDGLIVSFELPSPGRTG